MRRRPFADQQLTLRALWPQALGLQNGGKSVFVLQAACPCCFVMAARADQGLTCRSPGPADANRCYDHFLAIEQAGGRLTSCQPEWGVLPVLCAPGETSCPLGLTLTNLWVINSWFVVLSVLNQMGRPTHN